MTTTAHAVPALEVSAPDDNMDLLSDTGFDFGDGDIDLDLDTAPSVHDDDMSLQDAATDGGVDMQDPPADQDDFMADHGDLIEEDDTYNDDGAVALSQTLDESATSFEADMLAPPDEDLIDYSDDEAQQQVKTHSPLRHEEDAHASYEAETTSMPVDDDNQDVQTQADAQPIEPTEAINDEAQTHKDDVTETSEGTEASPKYQSADAELQYEDDADDGGVPLPTDEHLHHGDASAEQQEPQQEAGDDNKNDEHNEQQIELRPVTVNYAGNELWLFKQHDLDESGDFLLEDLSVAKSSISNVFRACRLSLGDDVSGEHEIGFRFDHLHNLELYEDNTACVAVSLERLIDLYHTLQAQDGNEDPECFYITLQFRPRFATLLADIAQYAEQGSGYSALDAAVAAGETHFSNVFSSASTEHDHVEWDDEEHEGEEASSPSSALSVASEGAGAGEHDEEHFEEFEDREEGQDEDLSQDHTQHQQNVDLEVELKQTVDTQDGEPRVVQEIANSNLSESLASHTTTEHVESAHEPEVEAAAERHASESQDERTPDQVAHDRQEAEDFVDYSDDEDDQETKSVPAREPSPASSTVQGDEHTEIHESGLAPEHNSQEDENAGEAGFNDANANANANANADADADATLLTRTQYADDANHYAFQDYAETYEQDDPFQDYQADGTVGDSFEANDTYNDDTNQDFADYNFHDLDEEINLGFDEQPLDEADHGDHGNKTFEAVEDVIHAGALLDFDDAPEWAVDADPASNLPGEDAVLLHDNAITHEDEEGAAVKQAAATTSSAADLTLTSSNDHGPPSPQGQKRSIDEVDDGVDDAPDSTDIKRPRV